MRRKAVKVEFVSHDAQPRGLHQTQSSTRAEVAGRQKVLKWTSDEGRMIARICESSCKGKKKTKKTNINNSPANMFSYLLTNKHTEVYILYFPFEFREQNILQANKLTVPCKKNT
jgi:hypothetical protein